MKTVTIIVGSIRKESWNKKLAEAVAHHAKGRWTVKYADIASLPLYNDDLWPNPPAAVGALKALIEGSDGVVVITPEYNRSMSGVLKNALDWASRPGGKSSFKGKPAAILGASQGPTGTAAAQSQLRAVMGPVGAHPMQQPEVYVSNVGAKLFNDDGSIADDKLREQLLKYIDAFDVWMGKLA